MGDYSDYSRAYDELTGAPLQHTAAVAVDTAVVGLLHFCYKVKLQWVNNRVKCMEPIHPVA